MSRIRADLCGYVAACLSFCTDNLSARYGFQVLGRTPDRFRVDGHWLDVISMTVNVAHDE
jgi:hypothetical protein